MPFHPPYNNKKKRKRKRKGQRGGGRGTGRKEAGPRPAGVGGGGVMATGGTTLTH